MKQKNKNLESLIKLLRLMNEAGTLESGQMETARKLAIKFDHALATKDHKGAKKAVGEICTLFLRNVGCAD